MILIRICIKTKIKPFSPHHFSMCDNNNTEVLLQTLNVLNASTFMSMGHAHSYVMAVSMILLGLDLLCTVIKRDAAVSVTAS